MADENGPPEMPWVKGIHDDHAVIGIDVEVCRMNDGRVFSSHKLQTREDLDIAMSWPGGGQEQVAFALLTEAVRREATVALLLKMSNGDDFMDRLRGGDEDEAIADELAGAIRRQMDATIERVARGATLDAIRSIRG